jgi:hypothetical protein
MAAKRKKKPPFLSIGSGPVPQEKEKAPLHGDATVDESLDIFREIQDQRAKSPMIMPFSIGERRGSLPSETTPEGRTLFLRRQPKKNGRGDVNHYDESRDRCFASGCVQEAELKVCVNRKRAFKYRS